MKGQKPELVTVKDVVENKAQKEAVTNVEKKETKKDEAVQVKENGASTTMHVDSDAKESKRVNTDSPRQDNQKRYAKGPQKRQRSHYKSGNGKGHEFRSQPQRGGAYQRGEGYVPLEKRPLEELSLFELNMFARCFGIIGAGLTKKDVLALKIKYA